MARKSPSHRTERRNAARGEPTAQDRAGADRSDEGRASWQFYFWALLAFAAAGMGLLVWLDGRPKRRAAPRSRPAETVAANGSSAAATAGKPSADSAATGDSNGNSAGGGTVSAADLQPLLGRWLRQDGGYVLKVKDVSHPDKLDVAYLNPNEIHVERAEATRRDNALQVAIELRDVNYPGCLYELTLDQSGERLRGTYFQAALGETYDVEFVREP